MIPVHPTSTGGSGKEIPKSKFPSPTDPQDNRRNCYQCGFVTNDDTDAEGDTTESPGLQVVSSVVPSSGRTVYEMNVVGGCPFCGSFNRKGRRREDILSNTKDYSNL